MGKNDDEFDGAVTRTWTIIGMVALGLTIGCFFAFLKFLLKID
jgi:hypothetical protein